MKRTLTYRYLLALAATACLLFASFALVQREITKNELDGRIINISGRQRMLSQRIALLAREVQLGRDEQGALEAAADQMRNAHGQLMQHHWPEGGEALATPEIGAMYLGPSGLNAEVTAYLQVVDSLIGTVEQEGVASAEAIEAAELVVASSQNGLLTRLDDVVHRYERETVDKTVAFRQLEVVVLMTGLFVLLLEGLLLFRPMVSLVDTTLSSLERANDKLHTANRSMQLVLENVGDGLVTVDRQGVIGRERSAKAREWLGDDGGGTPLSDRVRELDPTAAEWLELGWQDLKDGFMPLDVTIDQLPKRIMRGNQYLKLSYIPIIEGAADSFEGLLVVMSDVSAEHARVEAEIDQKQLLALIEQMNEDRRGFQAFYQDGSELMELLATPEMHERASVLRWLHTLKGNALSYNMDRLGGAIHDLETTLQEENRQMNRTDAENLASYWDAIQQGMRLVTGQEDDGILRVPSEKAAALARAVANKRDTSEILGLLRSIAYQPASHRLNSLAQQAGRIADRFGLPPVDVVVEDNDVFIPAWSPFWSSVVHVVRNALDHGIEGSEERLAKGKPAVGQLVLAARRVDDCIEVSISDDGRGMDWTALRSKARELGLPSETDADLLEALFHNGFSTRGQATELSGRGVGMSAVRMAAVECGGTVHVQSIRGQGTTVVFKFSDAGLKSIAA